jgi:hypothetical protein
MTETDYTIIQALARCSFQPGSWTKRFVRDLASKPVEFVLSEKQQAALHRTAWHYRKQLAGFGIAIETRPPDALGVDKWAVQSQREQASSAAWNTGRKLYEEEPE